MGIRKAAAFGRRHVWSVTATAAVVGMAAMWGEVTAVSLMINRSFIAGYLLAAACGDVLIYAVGVPLLLWLPRRRARTTA